MPKLRIESWRAEARQLRAEGATISSLMERFGVSQPLMSKVCKDVSTPEIPRTVNGLPNWLALTMDEKIAAVRPLWDQGKTAAAISLEFSNASRNSIISLLNRANLRGREREKPVKKIVVRKPVASVPPIIERIPEPDTPPAKIQQMIDGNRPPIPGSVPVSILDLPNRPGVMCRFPVVGGYCGIQCGEAMYCDTHQAIMYRPVEKFRMPREAKL